MRRFFRFALMGLVLVAVAIASALTAMRLAIHGREATVPKLVGLSDSQAERAAADNGLLLERESQFYSETVPEGRVVSQVPQPGTRVRRGWRVRVAQSLGPQRAIIPSVLGQSPRAAEINIRRRGLEVGSVAVARLPELPADQVVAQSPPPAASGVASPKINLLVTAPAEQPAYVMPNFVGRHLADAARLIEEAGLHLASVTTVPGTAPSIIQRQSPAPGHKVTAGTSVTLEVSR